MKIDIVSVFPEYFDVLNLSLFGKAQEKGLIEVRAHNLRDWTHDVHHSVDDTPVGGGAGMVMKPAVWAECLDDLLGFAGMSGDSMSATASTIAVTVESGSSVTGNGKLVSNETPQGASNHNGIPATSNTPTTSTPASSDVAIGESVPSITANGTPVSDETPYDAGNRHGLPSTSTTPDASVTSDASAMPTQTSSSPDTFAAVSDETPACHASQAQTTVTPASASNGSGSGSDIQAPVLIFPNPSAPLFTQRDATELSHAEHLLFGCGRYEGYDARIPEYYRSRGVDVREYSIGDYVLNGGEVATSVMLEAITRLIPGFMGNADSIVEESYTGANALLEHKQYTKPAEWRGLKVPDVLLSGDHGKVGRFRRDEALTRTNDIRPDLIERLDCKTLDKADRKTLMALGWEVSAAHPRKLR